MQPSSHRRERRGRSAWGRDARAIPHMRAGVATASSSSSSHSRARVFPPPFARRGAAGGSSSASPRGRGRVDRTMMASSSSSTAADDAPPSSADKASLRCQAPGTINLAVGHPRELPSDVLAAAMTRSAAALRSDDARDRDAVPLNYVARRGPPAILETFASFLTDAYDGGRRPPRASSSSSSSSSSSPVTAASLVITNGVSHGLDLACGALTSPGDVVVMEIPTYFLAAAVFRDHGLEVIGVPGTDGEFEDDGGAFDVDALERRLVDDGLRPKARDATTATRYATSPYLYHTTGICVPPRHAIARADQSNRNRFLPPRVLPPPPLPSGRVPRPDALEPARGDARDGRTATVGIPRATVRVLHLRGRGVPRAALGRGSAAAAVL